MHALFCDISNFRGILFSDSFLFSGVRAHARTSHNRTHKVYIFENIYIIARTKKHKKQLGNQYKWVQILCTMHAYTIAKQENRTITERDSDMAAHIFP